MGGENWRRVGVVAVGAYHWVALPADERLVELFEVGVAENMLERASAVAVVDLQMQRVDRVEVHGFLMVRVVPYAR